MNGVSKYSPSNFALVCVAEAVKCVYLAQSHKTVGVEVLSGLGGGLIAGVKAAKLPDYFHFAMYFALGQRPKITPFTSHSLERGSMNNRPKDDPLQTYLWFVAKIQGRQCIGPDPTMVKPRLRLFAPNSVLRVQLDTRNLILAADRIYRWCDNDVRKVRTGSCLSSI
jgi:hypothetical protein